MPYRLKTTGRVHRVREYQPGAATATSDDRMYEVGPTEWVPLANVDPRLSASRGDNTIECVEISEAEAKTLKKPKPLPKWEPEEAPPEPEPKPKPKKRKGKMAGRVDPDKLAAKMAKKKKAAAEKKAAAAAEAEAAAAATSTDAD